MHSTILTIEQWVLRAMQGEGVSLTRSLLRLVSWFYASLIWIRGELFERGAFKCVRVKLPVVSIGNIIAGGTGKTSFTMKLAQEVGGNPAIISRGYRAQRKGGSRLVVDGADGDEPYLMKLKLPFASVIVGKCREESAHLAQELGAKWILLDDGMQYRKLYRDTEIAMIHADMPFGGGYYLPRGLLRESPTRLKVADYVVIQGASSETIFEELSKKIVRYTAAPIIGVDYVVMNAAEIAGKKIGAFCGIGRPEHFFRILKNMGCEIVMHKVLSDHQTLTDASTFIRNCREKGAEIIVCSEKDAVKLTALPEVLSEILPLKVSLEVFYGKQHYADLIKLMKTANARH